MGSISTFGSFTQARLAIYASQAGLTVTGNNISNINTDGYTRQKLDQTSFYAGGSDRYYSQYDIRIGNGTLCNGVSQLRDPYLDIRYRNEMASVGAMDTTLSVLEQIEQVLDEVGDGEDGFGVIADQLSDLYNQLAQLSDQTGQEGNDILVRTSAETLANLLNSYSAELQKVYDGTVLSFQEDVKDVNVILNNIRGLNESIRKAEIHGDNALELRDERNVLIDQLSEYMKINVTYTMEDIGGIEVERLNISLDNGKLPKQMLVDGTYCTQLSMPAKVTDADGNLVDNTSYSLALSALKDSKDRLLYTTELTGTTYTTNVPDPFVPSETTTDDATGVITITTYAKTSNTQARKDDQGNFLDKDGNIVTEAEAQQLPVYYVKTYTKTPSQPVELGDNDLYGSLQAMREMLTEEGEFTSQDVLDYDPAAATKRGIPYYQKVLDLFANQIAETFNKANQGFVYNQNGNYVTADGTEITLEVNGADTTISKNGLTDDQAAALNAMTNLTDANGNLLPQTATTEERLTAYLQANGGQFLGGVLFSNNGNGNDDSDIRASNISISAQWAEGPLVVNSFEQYGNLAIGSTDSSNILHMMAMMNASQVYDPTKIKPDAVSTDMFEGSFAEMWNEIGSVLGKDMKFTSTMLDTYYATSVELDSSRDSVSAVDLNDEAMNLMQYSKSYNAACRLMTTLDSVLDKLINGTGMTT